MLVGVQQQKAHVIRRLKAKHGDAVNVPLLGTAPKAVGERVQSVEGGVFLRKQLPVTLNEKSVSRAASWAFS